MKEYLQDWGHGIWALDSGFSGTQVVAVHILQHGGRTALIDTSSKTSVPRTLQALDYLGIPRNSVDWIILTHVHLDHAGGAGLLMEHLPEAKLLVHPRGQRHMIDPAKLWAATQEVYGAESAEERYGSLAPIPAERTVAAPDGTVVEVGGRRLECLDTAGHARHHICIRDTLTGHVFTGDTFGFSYREWDHHGRQFILPTMTPTQFDPEALHSSIDRIMAGHPEAVYVTHYSQLRDTPRLAADLHRLIDAHVAEALAVKALPVETRTTALRERLSRLMVQEANQQGWALQGDAVLKNLEADIRLNTDGLLVWLETRHPAQSAP